MELSSTAYVILGMLSWRPMSGYDIKAVVDRSTRFFWAASYSQIYSELRELEGDGLVSAEERPQGGRRRNVHRITEAGRAALAEWLTREPDTFELRDEGLLKLFFASASPETALSTLTSKRDHHRRTAERLEAMQQTGGPSGYPAIVLGYGIECNRWMAEWCQRALADLDAAEPKSERGRVA